MTDWPDGQDELEDVRHTIALIIDQRPRYRGRPPSEGTLQVATFHDPGGNLIGIWTETAG